jgi:hypothetical protein
MKVLTGADVEIFHEQGLIHCSSVFNSPDALAFQAEIWDELEQEFSIMRDDPPTWRVPPRSPKKAKTSLLNDRVINDRFRAIINDLLGPENWKEPNTWGGFLLTFPTPGKEPWELAHNLWHWDYELSRGFDLKGLLIFSFYSDVVPQGGGTLVVRGAHRVLERYYEDLTPAQRGWKHGEQRKHFMSHDPWFSELSHPQKEVDRKSYFMDQDTEVRGVPVRVLELTGQPGDVVFCHPRLIHAPSGINLNDYPRMMRVKFLW